MQGHTENEDQAEPESVRKRGLADRGEVHAEGVPNPAPGDVYNGAWHYLDDGDSPCGDLAGPRWAWHVPLGLAEGASRAIRCFR